MKTKTEKILTVMKIIAFIAAVGFSIECGSALLSFIASFFNAGWAQNVYDVNQEVFSLRNRGNGYYVYAMSLVIFSSALKATIWYLVMDLLIKIRLNNPFSPETAKRFELIAYLLLGVWIISSIGKAYFHWLTKTTGIQPGNIFNADEYLFISGLIYILSLVFKRGIEIQEENQLTV